MNQKCEEYLDDIEEYVRSYKEVLTEEDYRYCLGYVEKGRELNRDGLLGSHQLLVGEWNEYNFRYGVDSVKGTLGELIAVISVTKSDVQGHMIKGDRVDDVSGRDIRLSSFNWKNDYYGQVKCQNDISERVYVRENFFGYSPLKVQRLLVVDLSGNVLHLDYRMVREEYLGIVRSRADRYVTESTAELMRYGSVFAR